MTVLVLVASAILLSAMSNAAAPRVLQGNMNFYYDPPSQYFMMETTSKCYITALTRNEKDHIHSNQGIEDLELTYVREWLGALNETLIYHTDPNLPVTFQSRCKDRDIFYLNRILPSSATLSAMSVSAAPRPLQGYMTFYYDPPSQLFLMETTSKCYITALTRNEKDHIHSNQGIEDLELTYVREWLGALSETLIYHTDPNIPVTFQGKCKDRDIFYLNRILQSSATVPSIFG